MFKCIRAICLLLTLGVLLSACTTEMNSKVGSVLNLDTDLKLMVSADENVNPDESEKPSPVFVRLYELKDTQSFKSADFISLYERDEEVLGKSFVTKQELKRLAPGDQREERFVLSAETQFIALYAEFFDYKNAKYKVVFPVTRNNILRDKVKVRLTDNRILLEE